MTYRSFTLHRRDGCQMRAIATLTSSVQAKTALSGKEDGDYTVRDCLGGLRMILRVTDGKATPIETTR